MKIFDKALCMAFATAMILLLPTVTKASSLEKEGSNSGRYQETTFGEIVDSSVCLDESKVEVLTEAVVEELRCKYVTAEVLESLAYQESRFVLNAKNGGAVTMFQFKPCFHEEELLLVGLTQNDLDNARHQVLGAASILERYAEARADGGLTGDDVTRAALMDYHSTTERANAAVELRSWDSYCNAVMERADVISKNKELGVSAKVIVIPELCE